MNLKEWKSKPTAVQHAKRIQSTETYKEMVGVLREEAPLNRTGLPFGAMPTDYAYALGMQKGYDHAMKVLAAMGESSPAMPEEIEATFSKDNYNAGE